MGLIVKTGVEVINEENRKWPNRHKEIHKGCCKHCPSNRCAKNGIIDPESDEIKTFPKELIVKEYLFVCAWRPNKLCKGNCNAMGIDETFIKQVYNE